MREEKYFVSEWLLLLILFGFLFYLGIVEAAQFLTWAECPKKSSLTKLSNNHQLLRVASDEETFERATRAEETQDEFTINALLSSGKFFLVVEGTEAQVLEVGWTKVRVRIMEGEHMGREGYVSIGWVKRGTS